MTDRDVMEAVARVDCWLRDALRLLPVVAVLGAALLLAVMAALAWVRNDPHRIDYDARGVDITSEGPDGDWTEAWYKMKNGGDRHD